jgi:hypothetical protein
MFNCLLEDDPDRGVKRNLRASFMQANANKIGVNAPKR